MIHREKITKALVLALVLVFLLTACGNNKPFGAALWQHGNPNICNRIRCFILFSTQYWDLLRGR